MTEPSSSGWSAFHAFITNIYPVFLIAWSLFLVRLVTWTGWRIRLELNGLVDETARLREINNRACRLLNKLDRVTMDYPDRDHEDSEDSEEEDIETFDYQ